MMEPRRIVILGSTGSIGTSALDVIAGHPERFEIIALAAHSNVEALTEQYRRYRPKYLCLADSDKAQLLAARVKNEPVQVLGGEKDLISLAGLPDSNIVLNAVVGSAGLLASLEAIKNVKDLALANKESLVAGGPLFEPLMKRSGARLLPIDSEHSAIWQALNCGKRDEIRNLILTASGGPFRTYPKEKLATVTVKEALHHPTWNMGPKISVDSATLANKGLEVIEAVALFSVPSERVKVVIHPQSIVHSMVEFVDSSVMAQLSRPDMRLPITYALFWPDRVESGFGQIDWRVLNSLTFEEPDLEKFPMLKLGFDAAAQGGTAPAIYNAANEMAVAAFLAEHIKYIEIAEAVNETIAQMDITSNPGLEDILNADRRARDICRKNAEKIECS